MKSMYKGTRLFAIVAALFLAALHPLAQAADDKYQAIIQMSNNAPAKWHLALNNANNLIKELGKDAVQIEIVAFGPGINMFKAESEVSNRLKEASANGVVLAACANTLKALKLTMADLTPVARSVPSGVVEVVRKQKEGWSYVTP